MKLILSGAVNPTAPDKKLVERKLTTFCKGMTEIKSQLPFELGRTAVQERLHFVLLGLVALDILKKARNGIVAAKNGSGCGGHVLAFRAECILKSLITLIPEASGKLIFHPAIQLVKHFFVRSQGHLDQLLQLRIGYPCFSPLVKYRF